MVDNISLNYDNDDTIDPYCMGCNRLIEEGNVVAFGEGIWHVQCFQCAKCHNLVEHDSNLLLLSDGNPICENCSYNCHVCKKPILNEAIMTGDESFHVDCFRCRQCHKKIEDLIFAKTNQGIYCMSCHNERVNKAKKAKEREISNPPSVLEKSLPSLPIEAESEQSSRLEPPDRSMRHKRSFEQNNISPSISPKTSSDTIEIPKAHTLPPSNHALEQITGKPNGHTKIDDKHKNRGDSSETSKKTGFFSKKNESLDNPPKIRQTENRGKTTGSHTRNASITSFRSEPYEGGMGRTFSISSQRSDITDILSRKSDHGDTDNSSRKAGSPSSSRKAKSSNIQQSHPHLPHIDENTTNVQLSPPSHSEYYSNTPDSPATSRSSSPTSPRFRPSLSNKAPPVPRKSGHFNGLEIGPPVLPPLSFSSGDDDLSRLVASGQNDEKRKNRRGDFSKDKNIKILNGVDSMDFEGFSSGSSPMSPNRKNSGSSITSLSSRENEIIITEPEDVPLEELQKAYADTKKKLTEAESNVRKIKRESKRAYEEFTLEFNNEITLRKKTEEQIRAQLDKQTQQIEELKKEKAEMEQLIKDSRFTKQQLQEMQHSLSVMNVQKELNIKEIEGLAKEKQAGLAGTFSINSNSTSDLPTSLARHISTHLDEVKQNYLSEIRSLQTERDLLKDETENLRYKRDQFIEEAQKLNEKNLELAEMNNDLLKQIELHHKGKNHNAFNFWKSSKLPHGHHHTDSVSTHSKISGHGKSPSVYNFETDAPEGASIDSLQKVRGVTPKKFKWKNGGKVLNKLLANANVVVNDVKPYMMGTSSSNISLPAVSNETRDEAKRRMMSQMLDYTMNRPHNWQQFNLASPIKCDYCHEKMWGVAELKCSGCSFAVHVKCSYHVTSNCTITPRAIHLENDPDSDVNGTFIFGNDLTKQSELDGNDIPNVVQKCVKAVEIRGMDLEGIYRKNGGALQMRAIISAFEKGEEIDLDDPDQFNDISAVTSVFKQYLRDLPNPLFTYELYPNFLELVPMPNGEEKIEKFRELLLQLPKVNYATAKYIIEHLYRVKQFEAKNLMTAKNLSLVFGPTLLQGPDPNSEIFDMNFKNAAVEYIIEHSNSLFINNGERPGFIL
ncbi:RhoGAP-domain-containing protein [Rhizophagus irregularis]|uniref:RhoGAP-domain-containing protein n=1 Tax=Rhizophagus irregularis TaxID=588596 RepID=A0A2I1H774_9GLOM|nr:RhoGAP-domain-containing protein [Rhizophagus irregularis]